MALEEEMDPSVLILETAVSKKDTEPLLLVSKAVAPEAEFKTMWSLRLNLSSRS